MKTIEELKKKAEYDRKVLNAGAGSKNPYSDKLKLEVIDFMYENDISSIKLSKLIGISNNSISKWKRKFGKEQTGFVFGKTVRFDVRTKCLAVKDVKDGMRQVDVAVKYNTTTQTIRTWVSKYKNDYESHIDNLPDGVPYIVQEEKIVQGNKNIEDMRVLLASQLESINTIIQHVDDISKTDLDALHRVKNKVENKSERLETFIELQKEFGVA